MLPPSLRLLVRHPGSPRLQCRSSSTGTKQSELINFLEWARKKQGPHRPIRSQSPSRHGNARGGSSSKKRTMKKGKGPSSSCSGFQKNLPNVRTREKRMPASSGKEEPSSSTVKGWSGENWKAENWGSDKLRPIFSQELAVEAEKRESLNRKSESEEPKNEGIGKRKCTRKLQGVFTPLGFPVLQDVEPLAKHLPIATLAHKLDRVLFNPGVHWLEEPRSGVYNFTPWLQKIPDVNNFAFERLPPFVKSSRDEDLWELAKRERKTFGGSTSSLTGMLSQVYFLISGIRLPDVSSLSLPFQRMPADFTPSQLMPASVILNYKDGVYAIDTAYNKRDDSDKNVLIWLGKLLEKFLTIPPEEFRGLLRHSPNPAADSGDIREAYRYAKSGRFVMRAQLDCHDPRLPGTGVFDLKTRAALPVRMDLMNYQQHSTYLIRTLQGKVESFEREYYDLMRSAFLKYSFQARIGGMDGVLVAHHNTARMFGFRYIPLSEMEACLFGGRDRGEAVFEKCVLLLEEILKEVISRFPGQSVRCLFETRGDKLEVFAEPEARNKSKGPRPITHMVVRSTSYIDGDLRDSKSAVAMSGSWDLHWSISHPPFSLKQKRRKLKQARERRLGAYSLPPGVSVKEMEDIWNRVDFGKQRGSEETPETSSGDGEHMQPSAPFIRLEGKGSTFDPSLFAPPSRKVISLRALSVQGKVDLELMLEKTKGRPKLIWGETEAYTDQVEFGGASSGTKVAETSKTAGEP